MFVNFFVGIIVGGNIRFVKMVDSNIFFVFGEIGGILGEVEK